MPTAPRPVCPPGEPVLRARSLTKGFGGGGHHTLALRAVDFDLRAGELNLLMGPSGSGKSTLLAVISALLRPDAGTVEVFGEDLWARDTDSLEAFRLAHCSYIFQGYNLFPALTALEQCEIILKWGEGLTRTEARKRAESVLTQLGLANKLHLRPAQLSGGEKQRTAIARALVKNPAFVFADEPTGALDWENGRQVIELLRECAHTHHSSVLVVTHDHRLVPFADRVFEMSDGRLLTPDPLPESVNTGFAAPRLVLRDPFLVAG